MPRSFSLLFRHSRLGVALLIAFTFLTIFTEILFLRSVNELIALPNWLSAPFSLYWPSLLFFTLKISSSLALSYVQPSLAFSLLNFLSFSSASTLLNRKPKSNLTDTIRLALTESDHATMGYLLPIISGFTELVILLGIIIFLVLEIGPTLLLLIAIVLVLSALFFFPVSIYQSNLGHRRMRSERKRLYYLQAIHSLDEELYAFRTRDYFLGQLRRYTSSLSKISSSSSFFQQLPKPAVESILFASFFLCVLIPGISTSSPLFTSRSAALVVLASFRIIPSISRLVCSVQSIRYSYASFLSVSQLLIGGYSSPHQSSSKSFAPLLVPVGDDSEQISFSFTNPAAETTQLVKLIPNALNLITGPSGCGKSTFLYSLQSLFLRDDPQIDLIPYFSRTDRPISYTYMPQHSALLDGSLAVNIQLHENPSLRLYESHVFSKWLSSLDLQDIYERFYDSPISSLLDNVSGGEARRICLMRHLCTDATYFLLDEPTTGLPLKQERKILQELARDAHASSRTYIVVTHSSDLRCIPANIITLSI